MKRLSLILSFFVIFSLVFSMSACGSKKQSSGAASDEDTPSDSQSSDTEKPNTDGGNIGTDPGTEEGAQSEPQKTLQGNYVAENGSTYAFNGGQFSYTPAFGFCFRGTYAFRKTESGTLRILLTITHEGANPNAFSAVEMPYIVGGPEGLAYREKSDGSIFISQTWYAKK